MMQDLFTGSPGEIVIFYATVIVGALYFLLRKRPRRGMLLRLRERTTRWRDVRETGAPTAIGEAKRFLHSVKRPLGEGKHSHAETRHSFGEPPRPLTPNGPERFSHIQPTGERPLNVMFNYNGHSWDAYEVLGLPAGSSLEKVDEAYSQALKKADVASRGFLTAAHAAIETQWNGFKKASQG